MEAPATAERSGTTTVRLPAVGLHNTYLTVQGSGSSFVVRVLGINHLCIGGASVGVLLPLSSGDAIPPVPAAG